MFILIQCVLTFSIGQLDNYINKGMGGRVYQYE